MEYDIREIAAIIDSLEPKTVFKMKNVINTNDPSTNKVIGKQLKEDVDLGLTNAVSIGKDSANAQWYARKP